jgi:hypothetical protein
MKEEFIRVHIAESVLPLLGIGALASQLGSATVSAVPGEQSGEVGGVQNTMTNLGASIGTALAGAVLISALTASFLTGVQNNPAVRPGPGAADLNAVFAPLGRNIRPVFHARRGNYARETAALVFVHRAGEPFTRRT